MASSFEKSVKGATKIKLAPPKTKYIEHILVATHSGEAGVGEVFRALQNRLRDSTWTVVFKSLITVHLMIREGSPDATLAYLGKHRNMLAVSMFSDAQTQGRNIRHYANYLSERARAYRETKCDWVRVKEDRLEKLSVDKGLLRETETVQHQLTALLKCDVLENEPENEITITVFRLLVLDLLALFQVLNQAMINILGHFFEMSKTDADRAMEIYRTFTRQTDFVVQYLSVARQYEHHTRVEVPKLKHAPVNLGRQLEEYLKDPDFEIHRRQYLAELEAKKTKGGSSGAKLFGNGASKFDTPKASSSVNGSTLFSKPVSASKAPETNLIDFFESIEQNQTPMATQPTAQGQIGSPWATNGSFQTQNAAQFQTNGFVPGQAPQQIQQQTGFQTGFQNTAPFQQQNMAAFSPQPQPQSPPQQLQPNFIGAGFGGFSPQPSFQPTSLGSIPQDSVASFQTGAAGGFSAMSPQQTTNPFRASMMLSQQTGQVQPNNTPFSPSLQQRPSTSASTNPFARASPQTGQQAFASPGTNPSPFQSPAGGTNSSFQSAGPASTAPFQSPPLQAAPLLPMATGTNPFQKTYAPPQPLPQQQQQRPVTAGGLVPQATGTNPFRTGPFGTQNTGWQNTQQPIGGGLDQLQTIPVFPRTGQQQSPWQT